MAIGHSGIFIHFQLGHLIISYILLSQQWWEPGSCYKHINHNCIWNLHWNSGLACIQWDTSSANVWSLWLDSKTKRSCSTHRWNHRIWGGRWRSSLSWTITCLWRCIDCLYKEKKDLVWKELTHILVFLIIMCLF